ncbi:MAG: ammonia channel protein, partial [Pseudorhodoplanes sp.]|nr:ammonia channel protein [Pseudorhodoplanes sp.]
GTLLTGVFATAAITATPELPGGQPGLIEGNAGQVALQAYGVAVAAIWSGVMTYVVLKIVGLMTPLRVNTQEEMQGLDITQHGESLQ